MSLKYKPCCSQQGYQEFNFSQMVFSSSLQPASVRREQDAHSVPGCALHRAHPEHEPSRTHKRCTRSLIQNPQSGDMQGTAHSPLLTLGAILAPSSPQPQLFLAKPWSHHSCWHLLPHATTLCCPLSVTAPFASRRVNKAEGEGRKWEDLCID